MSRFLLSVLFSLLLEFAFSSSFNGHFHSVNHANMQMNPEMNPNSGNAIPTNNASTTNTRCITHHHFDLHPPALPQNGGDLEAYQALFNAMSRRDYDTTFLILTLFPQLKLTRYIHELQRNIYVNFYHMAALSFPLEELKILISFGKESELLYPYSKCATVLDIVAKANQHDKVTFLTPIFARNAEKVRELREVVKNNGIIGLFTRHAV